MPSRRERRDARPPSGPSRTARTRRDTRDALYDIPFQDAQGRTRTLREFQGDVLLIVNTASY